MKRPELGQRRQKGDFRVGQFMIPNIQPTKRRMAGQVVEIPVVAAVLFRVWRVLGFPLCLNGTGRVRRPMLVYSDPFASRNCMYLPAGCFARGLVSRYVLGRV